MGDVNRVSAVTDRRYWVQLARCHWNLGNREGFRWALDRAREAPVQADFMAARLALTDERRAA